MGTESKLTTTQKTHTDSPQSLQEPIHESTSPRRQPLSKTERVKREMARRELAKLSYKRYLYYIHGQAWKRTRMSDFLADEIQRFVDTDTGNAYDILILNTPPQHGKSMTVTEAFPSWYLGTHPMKRVIIASYNDDTATKFGRKNKEKIEQYGGTLFDAHKGSVWSTTDMELDNGWGRIISRGLMSGITGNPADLFIIDDPIKNREEADSQTQRDKMWDEWQSSLKSRFAAKAKIIIIATPWHEDDLMARVAKNEPNVRVIRLPIEAEEDDPLGRKPGDSLAPELGKDNKWLEQFKQGYINDTEKGGRRAWASLYQCKPRPESGNMVLRQWWRYYEPEEIKHYATTVISVDAAFKDSDDNDFVAIEVWSKIGAYYYLRYLVNKHLNFPATVQEILRIRALFPETMYTVIEDKANGSAVIQVLQKRFPGVIPVTPKGGKVSRVNSISNAIESGNVFVPKGRVWAEEMIDQFTAFPSVKHDDMVDAATQALSFMIYSSGILAQSLTEEEKAIRAADRAGEQAFLSDGIYDVYSPEYTGY